MKSDEMREAIAGQRAVAAERHAISFLPFLRLKKNDGVASALTSYRYATAMDKWQKCFGLQKRHC